MLINTDLGKGSGVRAALLEVPEVTEVHEVYGTYDIIARVQTETMEKLKDTLSTKIRGLSHVRSTLTLIVVE